MTAIQGLLWLLKHTNGNYTICSDNQYLVDLWTHRLRTQHTNNRRVDYIKDIVVATRCAQGGCTL